MTLGHVGLVPHPPQVTISASSGMSSGGLRWLHEPKPCSTSRYEEGRDAVLGKFSLGRNIDAAGLGACLGVLVLGRAWFNGGESVRSVS